MTGEWLRFFTNPRPRWSVSITLRGSHLEHSQRIRRHRRVVITGPPVSRDRRRPQEGWRNWHEFTDGRVG